MPGLYHGLATVEHREDCMRPCFICKSEKPDCGHREPRVESAILAAQAVARERETMAGYRELAPKRPGRTSSLGTAKERKSGTIAS